MNKSSLLSEALLDPRVIDRASFIMQHKERNDIFDRYFPNDKGKSDDQLRRCEAAVATFFKSFDSSVLESFIHELRTGTLNQWIRAKDLLSIMRRLTGKTDREIMALTRLDAEQSDECAFWFLQSAHSPDCPFVRTTIFWLRGIQIEQKTIATRP